MKRDDSDENRDSLKRSYCSRSNRRETGSATRREGVRYPIDCRRVSFGWLSGRHDSLGAALRGRPRSLERDSLVMAKRYYQAGAATDHLSAIVSLWQSVITR